MTRRPARCGRGLVATSGSAHTLPMIGVPGEAVPGSLGDAGEARSQVHPGALKPEGLVDRLDHTDDVDADLERRAGYRSVSDRRAEVRHLEVQRLGGVNSRRDDVAGPVRQLVLTVGLRVAERYT